jgi:hypothetical protein
MSVHDLITQVSKLSFFLSFPLNSFSAHKSCVIFCAQVKNQPSEKCTLRGYRAGTGTGRNRIHLVSSEPPYSEYDSGYKNMKQTILKN